MQHKKLPKIKSLMPLIITTMTRKPPAERNHVQLPGELNYSEIQIDSAHVSAFKNMFPDLLDEVPLSYVYTLAQRAQIKHMLHKQFPFRIPGLVHMDNHMQYHQNLDISTAFSIEQAVALHDVIHPSGERVVFTTDFMQNDQLAMHIKSTYFIRYKKRGKTTSKRKKAVIPDGTQSIENLIIPADTGRKYAKVSGDYNPIHLYAWSAKLLGFKRPIIHGMYLHSAFQNAAEKQFQKPIKSMDITFKKPVVMPAHVNCRIDEKTQTFYLTLEEDQEIKSMGTFGF